MNQQEFLQELQPELNTYNKLLRLMRTKDYDIISFDELELRIAMKRKEIIKKHKKKYPIWLSKDGRWKTRIPDELHPYGKLVARKNEESLLDLVVDWYMKVYKIDTLAGIYPEWLAYKKLETTAANAKKLAWAWNKYYEGEAITEQKISSIKVIDVKKWFMLTIDKRGLTRKQFKEMKSVLNSIFDYAIEMELVKVNVSRAVRGIGSKHFTVQKRKSAPEQVYMVDEQSTFMTVCEDFFNKTGDTVFLAACMNLHLGLRVGELVALKVSDFSDMYVHIEREEVENIVEEDGEFHRHGCFVASYTKTPESVRDVPLTSRARRCFEKICETNAHNKYNSEFLLINRNTGERMHADRIARALQRINRKMNTAQKGNHGIRRTYLSTLDAFGNLTDEEIRSVAGHKEITTTQNSYLYSVQRPESRAIQFEKALERLG